MHIIVCLDERDGMLFNHRRQSKDRRARQRILSLVGTKPLWVDAYTASQFEEDTDVLRIADSPAQAAAADEYCFLERGDLLAVADRVESVTVYRWNKKYPADTLFPTDAFAPRWKQVSLEEFPGFSHDIITEERYVL